MTVLLVIAVVVAAFAVWERVDAVKDALEDIIYLIEEHAQPERDAAGREPRGRRGGSRR